MRPSGSAQPEFRAAGTLLFRGAVHYVGPKKAGVLALGIAAAAFVGHVVIAAMGSADPEADGPESEKGARRGSRRGRARRRRSGLGSGSRPRPARPRAVDPHEAESRHPREVGVVRPSLRALVRSDRGDQQVRDAESLARVAGSVDPLVKPAPGRIGGGIQRQGGQRGPKASAVAFRRSAEDIEPDRRGERDLVFVEERTQVLLLGARRVPQGRDPDGGVDEDHADRRTLRRDFGTSTSSRT